MTSRDRTVLAVVVVLAVIVGGWFLLIQPKRNEADSLQGQITTQQSQLAALQTQIVAGETAKQSYAKTYAELARLGEALPTDDDVPSLLYQLQNAASKTKVDFHNFVLNPASSAAAPVPTGTTGATGATGAVGVPTALPPGAAIGTAGLPIEPFTLTFIGNYFHLASFLGRITKFVTAGPKTITVRGRLMTLNAISLGVAPQGFPMISVSINATTYLSPSTPAFSAPSTGSGTSSGTSSGTGSGTSTSSGPEFPSAAITPGTP